MIGFDNPGIPISLGWTMTGQTNVTAGTINGFLSSTIPHGNSLANVTFYVLAREGNGTMNQIFSFTKYPTFSQFGSFSNLYRTDIPETKVS